MQNDSNDFLFADEDSKKDDRVSSEEQWTILIVDDEKDIHEITKLLFSNFKFENKGLRFISAYSAKEARAMITENPDISLVLLDVVMEEDNAGLEFVKYVRDEIKNKLVRLIIRTGQPGYAPERKVIIDYDINDYKEKTELSQDKFYSSVIMALRSYRDLIDLQKTKNEIEKLLIATDRFVPHYFLHALNKRNLSEIQLGEFVELDLTVLFLDVRSFTLKAEKLTTTEIFKFINTMLKIVEPPIVEQGGFVDKYIGDSIMALFFQEPDSAINASIKILKALDDYNEKLLDSNEYPIDVGISINSGLMALGTIGYHDRMECTVISSVVNTAAKLEKMNKEFGTRLLITEDLFSKFENIGKYDFRKLGDIFVIGKAIPIGIIEILNTDPDDVKQLKVQTKPLFEKALASFKEGNFHQAHDYFQEIFKANNKDRVVEYFITKCIALEKNEK